MSVYMMGLMWGLEDLSIGAYSTDDARALAARSSDPEALVEGYEDASDDSEDRP